jgi:hypothetical protein
MAESSTQETGLVKPTTNEVIRMGMDTVQGFEAIQRCARLLSASPLVPEIYRGDKGLPSCVIALNLAARIGADPLLVMQNLYVVQGRPGWSSKFLIATFNQCGKFSAIRYQFEGVAGTDEYGCRAWAIEKATNEKLIGPLVTIGLAKKEGWLSKSGSKWLTMPEQMLRYRSGGWFINTIAPELAMGLPAADEIEDFVTIDGETGEITQTKGSPRVVGSSAPVSGMPKALGDWTNEQIDELEGLIEEIVTIMRSAGFVAQAEEFEGATRAKRGKIGPSILLDELRKSLESLQAMPTPEPGPGPAASGDAPDPANADGSLIADPDAGKPVVTRARGAK